MPAFRCCTNFPLLDDRRGEWGAKSPADRRAVHRSGLAALAGLDGVFDLDLFWHIIGITTDGFAHLVHLPNLAGSAAMAN